MTRARMKYRPESPPARRGRGLGRWLASLPALLALVAPLACGAPAEPFRFTGEGGQPTPVTIASDVPLVEVTLDQGTPHTFLLDTGSPATLLDPDPYGLPEGPYRPATLSAFGITAEEPLTGVLDLFSGQLALGGIVGGDLLRHFALTLDYRDAVALLYVDLARGVPPYGTDLAPATQVGFSRRGGGVMAFPGGQRLTVPATRIVVTLLVEGEEVVAVLDTGASTLVLDEARFDALAAARPERPRLLGLDVITVDGARPAELSRAARVALADAEPETECPSIALMVVRDSPALASVAAEVGRPVEALLGGSYLREFQITIDYPAERLTLRRYAAATHLNPREWISVGFTWVDAGPGVVQVESLFQDSDADALGITPGDRILAAGGWDIAAYGGQGVQDAVDASDLGDRVAFTLSRGGTPYEAAVLIEDLLPAFQ